MAKKLDYQVVIEAQNNARRALDEFVGQLDDINKNAKKTKTRLNEFTGQVNKIGGMAKSVGRKMTAGLTTSIFALGTMAVKKAADMETLQTSLESMVGGADEAKKVLKSLTDFTAKTPFQLEGVAKAGKQLLAFGVEQKNLEKRLKVLGDIASGAKVPLSDMAAIFGKIKAKGKAMTEEILQMSDRGIPIIDVLAKKLGVAKGAIFGMASQGELSFGLINEALTEMTENGGIFANQMKKQSATVSGIFSTLKDNLGLALGEMGKTISETIDLKKVMNDLIVKVQGAVQWFKELNPETREMIVKIAGLTAIIGPLLVVLGTLASSVTSIVSLVSGFGVAIKGVIAFAPQMGAALTALTGPIGLVALAVTGITAAIISIDTESTKRLQNIKETYSMFKDEVELLKNELDENVKKAQNALNFAIKAGDEAMIKSKTEALNKALEAQKSYTGKVIELKRKEVNKLVEMQAAAQTEIDRILFNRRQRGTWGNIGRDLLQNSADFLSLGRYETDLDKINANKKTIKFGNEQIQKVKNYPERALGGFVQAGQPYLVGERHPEVFVPTSNGRVEPKVSSSGETKISIQINNPNVDNEHRIHELTDTIISSITDRLNTEKQYGLIS